MNPVVIGAPRSGTHYFAGLMGWNHEVYYRPGTEGGPVPPAPEVSWAAVPFVDPSRTLVIHLVRHPRAVLASNLHRGWMNPKNVWGRFASEHAGTWDLCEFLLRWYDRADALAHSTVRLEDVGHLGSPTNRFGDPAPAIVPPEYRDRFAAVAERHGYGWPL